MGVRYREGRVLRSRLWTVKNLSSDSSDSDEVRKSPMCSPLCSTHHLARVITCFVTRYQSGSSRSHEEFHATFPDQHPSVAQFSGQGWHGRECHGTIPCYQTGVSAIRNRRLMTSSHVRRLHAGSSAANAEFNRLAPGLRTSKMRQHVPGRLL